MAIKNSQYDTIMREYQKKQLRAKHQLDDRYKEVYEKHPDIEELDQMISTISVQQAKKMLDGSPSALSELKSQLQSTTKKREDLLRTYGYPGDYLELQYDCSHCQDTGYINNLKCSCFKQAIIDLLYTQSNLKEILNRENFQTYTESYYEDFIDKSTGLSSLKVMQEIKKTCEEFVESFDTQYQNLFFYGEPGTGKTFFSNCIAKELIESEHSVIYLTIYQFHDILQKNKFKNDTDAAETYEYILDCDLLIIDDLGTEMKNTFMASELFFCLNERILRKKSTIISTNLSLEHLVQKYSERIFSRISSNYTLLKFIGKDIRIKKKVQEFNS